MADSSTRFLSRDMVRELLVQVCARNELFIDGLLSETSPEFVADVVSPTRTAYAKLAGQNIVCVGSRRALRLQAHAYASAVLVSVRVNPDFKKITADELRPQLAPADALLTWAVRHDIGAFLCQSPDPSANGKPDDATSIRDVIAKLTDEQRTIGYAFFRYSLGFVMLHELSHLKHRHTKCSGIESIEHERIADLDAARWMTDVYTTGASRNDADRQCALFGIAIGLLWLTTHDIFLGPRESLTHPYSYNRLYQVLEQFTDIELNEDDEAVWHFATLALACHMHAAGYSFMQDKAATTWKEATSRLIDRISRFDRG